jgi:hypothetical protein
MYEHYCCIVTEYVNQYTKHTSVATENVFKEDLTLCKANSLLCKLWGSVLGCNVVEEVSDILKYQNGVSVRVKQSSLWLLDPADKGTTVL